MKCSAKIWASLAAAFLTLAMTAQAAELAILSNGFTIRHERREVLAQVTRLYLGADKNSFIDVATSQIVGFEKDNSPSQPPAVASQDFMAAVSAASDKHRIDSDFISSVIHAESSFNPRAVSPKGAQGLMQLMPGTASKLGVVNPFDPMANVDGGTRYLRELLDFYHDDMAKALAAYNAGPRRVTQYRGVPPYRETHAYVGRIIREYNRKKLAEKRARTGAASTVAANGSTTAGH
jgi:soluble lytic murein transglycosylase-like protein